MDRSDSSTFSPIRDLQEVALFGPQVTHWTKDSLSTLQSTLLQTTNLDFLKNALAEISSSWSILKKGFDASNINAEEKLKELENFATGGTIPDPQNLGNTQLAPLTIVSQVVDYVRLAGDRDDLIDFKAAQGFCIGFLSAAALASSSDWTQFKHNVSNSLRLAACIGIAIDAENASHSHPDRATAVGVRWKTPSDWAFLETSLDIFPDAYVSCVTDDRTLTITLPNRDQEAFCSRLREFKIATTSIGLGGYYHHQRHAKAAQTLKQLFSSALKFQLPSAEKLRLPLRSTSDIGLISTGSLHEIALDLILCKRAHWFQTVKLSTADIPHDQLKFVPLGNESCVPRSLLSNKPNSTNGDVPELIRGVEEVAVVGMACRFPQADSLEEFWQLITSGTTSTTELPLERFNTKDITRGPNMPRFFGNFLRRPDAFDHRFFGVSGREAKSMDPQQRLALQVAYEALESSGYCGLRPEEKETDVGCYLGVVSGDYEENVACDNANAFSATGTLQAFITGRISHHFGWTGPAVCLDTACSSSAVAIHTACKAILSGECAMALTGGVSIMTSPNMYQNLSAGGFLNTTGASKAFDASANGYCRGEGAGIIVLKKLSRAVVDGDTIIGVISGSAVNQGSNLTSITVPDSGSQGTLYKRALSMGLLEPKEVTYVEAHGTGTQVGDPIEYESVKRSLTGPWRNDNVFLGSVKDNIGHTEAASGVAAVIKTLLMMQYKTIPKQANFKSLNPKINASDSIIVPKATQSWTAKRYVALVNNYGAAGSNAAIVLREHAPIEKPSKPQNLRSSVGYPILLSGKTTNNLQSNMDALRSYLSKATASFADVAYNVARRQDSSFEHRASFVAADAQSLIAALGSPTARADATVSRKTKVPVVLSFGGQTGNNVTISKELYESSDLLRSHLDKCDAVCRSLGLPSIFPEIFQGVDVEDTIKLHCMLLSLQVSCAKSWIDSGLEVDTVIGHSFGQLSALCVAGSVSLEDAFRLVAGRAHFIKNNWGPERGVMVSVECGRKELDNVVSQINSMNGLRVDVACYNGPRSFVLAGDKASMEKVEEVCQSFKTTKLRNAYAYHSYLADNILDGYRKVAESVTIRSPRIHVETCSSNGAWTKFTAEEIVQHTRGSVYFSDAVERITARSPSAIWLEAGSATPIIAMARRIARKPERADTFISMDLKGVDAAANLANAVNQLWKAGGAAKYWPFHRSSRASYSHLNLPPYQFDATSHWIDFKSAAALVPSQPAEAPVAKPTKLVNMVESGRVAGEHLFLIDTTNAAYDMSVRGHAVTGQTLCPAFMYVEMATRSAMEVLSSKPAVQRLPHVEGLNIHAPLGLSGDSALYLRLRESAQETWDFSVYTQESEKENVEHARGRINLAPVDDIAAESRLKMLKRVARSSGVDRILNLPSATGLSGSIVYKLFSEIVEYAGYYRGVKSLSASENEAVGSVVVPAEKPFGLDTGIVDPIALDNFVQVSGIHVNCLAPRRDDEVFICNAIEEIILSAPFMANRSDSRAWTVHTRYETVAKGARTNDIFVYDAKTKDLVLAIMGAHFTSVPYKSLVRALTKANKSAPAIMVETVFGKSTYDSDSDQVDSGYQTRVPSPPAEGSREQPNVLEPLPKRPQVQQAAPEPAKADNTVQLVREMFSSIMEIPIEEILPTSDLAELGVDSLLSTEILSEVEKRFSVSVSQDQFMDCTDILSLCRFIQPNDTIEAPQITVENPSLADQLSSNLPDDKSEITDNETVYEEQTDNNFAVVCRESFIKASSSFDKHAAATGFTNFCGEAFTLQSRLVVAYVVEAFSALGSDLQAVKPHGKVPAFQFEEKHKHLIPQLYKILEDASLVKKESDGTFKRTDVPIPTIPSSTLHEEMLQKFPAHGSETKLLRVTAHKLAECLTGAADPLALMFRDATARELLGDVYTNGPMFKAITMLLADYLSSVLENFGNTNREIKILEIGAGTGGTTNYLVQALSSLGSKQKFSYTFTDISSSLVANARRRFSKWSSFMHFATLDLEKENAQYAGAYDIIISTNCVHATPDLVNSTSQIRKLLRPEGVLCLVESTRNLYWFDLVWGLVEGWWAFNDGREHALAHESRWKRDLTTAGYKWVDWSNDASAESDLLRVITASPYNAGPSGECVEEVERKLETKQTVTFKKVDGLDLQADIYYPSEKVESGKTLPVALMVHGGGHVMLSRDDIRPEQTDMLLKAGFLPISVDYRLCPETTLREGPMTDVGDALGWIRNVLPNMTLARSDVRVNGEKVVAVGWSTGGTIAMSLAWTTLPKGIQPPNAILAFYCPTDYEDPFWMQPNIPHGSKAKEHTYEYNDELWEAISDSPITRYNVPTKKRALGGWMAPSDPRSRLVLHMNWHGRALHVLLNGMNKNNKREPGTPSAEQIAAVSPLAQVRSQNYVTPTFIIHPRQDDLIPWQQAVRTYEALNTRGIDSELRIVEGVPHLFDLYREHQSNAETQAAVADGYEFLCKHVGLTLRK
ncbi:uncharacterized protein F4822DRAFT_428014 [Hypoxylon trugodes]|uniref:uncharacterized protein n=1 Tax=Hypoxylon trugodes TaxID=326681 RepID=UPI0021905D06|nr:uncharacterized protein F4822DRAFT_428014 [Hypoxylon trugodes]KAI1389672.1 hypothetical protein F4822DRAFT_428014 [Hypoxylon trugodes]